MAWLDPRTWFSSTPVVTPPDPTAPYPAAPYGGRRRKTRRARKGSKRTRTGKRSNRS
jgi:hypothetical protein